MLPVVIDGLQGQTKFAGAITVMLFFPFFALFFISGLVCLLIWAVRAAYFACRRVPLNRPSPNV
jgi:flagellar biogenesis protein FliO